MTEETHLRQLVPGGEATLVETVLAPHTGGLQRVARALLADPDEAEDALQEVLVRAITRLPTLDPRRPLRPWLHRVMINECLTRLRRRKRESAALATWAQGQEQPATDDESRRVLGEVTRALAVLPPRQRTAVALVSFGGLDVCGAARAMGCSEGAVKSHLHRARERLKAELGELLPGEHRHDEQTGAVRTDVGQAGAGGAGT